MALRFRNTLSIAPGVRLNIGKRSISVSAGVRGASMTLGQHGVWANAGLPGTGLSYRTRLTDHPVHQRRAVKAEARQRQQTSARQFTDTNQVDISLELDERGQLLVFDASGETLNAETRRLLWSQHAEVMSAWLQEQMDTINGDMDLLLNIHTDMPAPGSVVPEYEPDEFSEPEPERPQRESRPPRPEKPILRRQFLDRLFTSRARQRELDHLEAIKHWESSLVQWQQLCIELDRAHEERLGMYQAHQQGWEKRRAHHAQKQVQRAALFEQQLGNDPSLMETLLRTELKVLDWPRETCVDFELNTLQRSVYIDVDLPQVDEMPTRTAEWGANQQRLLIQDKSQRQLRMEYARHIHGCVLRVAGVVFGLLPAIKRVVVSGYTQRVDRATGNQQDQYLISVEIAQDTFKQINFDALEALDPVEALTLFRIRRSMTATGIFKAIKPFGPT